MVPTPLNNLSPYWAIASAPTTAPYCQIMPDNACVLMGYGKNDICEITALRAMSVKILPPTGANLVTINGKPTKSDEKGVIELNQGYTLACVACSDCLKKDSMIQMCVEEKPRAQCECLRECQKGVNQCVRRFMDG